MYQREGLRAAGMDTSYLAVPKPDFYDKGAVEQSLTTKRCKKKRRQQVWLCNQSGRPVSQHKIWNPLFTCSYSLVFSLAHPFFCQPLPLLDAEGQSFSCCAIHCSNTKEHTCWGLACMHQFYRKQELTLLVILNKTIFTPAHFRIASAWGLQCYHQ